MLKEFKEFAVQGNVMDMAVGIIIGGAFGKIIQSLVNDVIMPVVGTVVGGVDFTSLKYVLSSGVAAGTDASGAVVPAVAEVAMKYGAFIQNVVDFTILAFCIFMMVRAMNKMKKAEAEAPAAPPANEVLLGEIRDLLKK